ncbi:MAG: AroM family protein [Clostridia bacterium]|nr:AroM family protein [Clostridia bacterium]
MPVISMLTIGQTPREDIAADLRQLLPEGWKLRQYGALDGLTRMQAEALCGYEGRGELLVTRMAGDSRQIELSADKTFARLQDCLERAEREGADLHLMACTGNFPAYVHKKTVLYPGVCQRKAALAAGKPVGVLIPNEAQRQQIAGWWAQCGAPHVLLEAADPFGGEEAVTEAVKRLKQQGAGLICLDCFGYTLAHKAAAEACGLPAVLPREVLCQLAKEELLCLN